MTRARSRTPRGSSPPSMWASGGRCRNSAGPGRRVTATVPRPRTPSATSTSPLVMAWVACWSRVGTMAGTLIGPSTATASRSPGPIPIMTCRACAAMAPSVACASLPTTRRVVQPRTTRTSSRMPTASMSRWASIRSRQAMSTLTSITASCSTRNGAFSTSARSSRRLPAIT